MKKEEEEEFYGFYLPSKISSLVRRLVASFVKKSLMIEIVDTFSVLNVASPLL